MPANQPGPKRDFWVFGTAVIMLLIGVLIYLVWIT